MKHTESKAAQQLILVWVGLLLLTALAACASSDEGEVDPHGELGVPASIIGAEHRGEEFAPSGLTRTVLDLKWDAAIDHSSLQPDDFWVGGNTPVEVLVSPRDPAIVQLYFTESPDQVGGTVRIQGEIRKTNGGGVWDTQTFETGFINDPPKRRSVESCFPNCPTSSDDTQEPTTESSITLSAEEIATNILATQYPDGVPSPKTSVDRAPQPTSDVPIFQSDYCSRHRARGVCDYLEAEHHLVGQDGEYLGQIGGTSQYTSLCNVSYAKSISSPISKYGSFTSDLSANSFTAEHPPLVVNARGDTVAYVSNNVTLITKYIGKDRIDPNTLLDALEC
jgi:hypothetical protein